ncbi:hypothetical protein DIPPA_13244 [Diplonema papillatum]|nr:hypothetical protein DIPPA_13244 [Diplonema papillatum]
MMQVRSAARAGASRAVTQKRFTSTEKVFEVSESKFDASRVSIDQSKWPTEFRNFDTADAYKNCQDVTGFSAWGIFWIAFQIQFLMVYGEGEPEFSYITQWRQTLEG